VALQGITHAQAKLAAARSVDPATSVYGSSVSGGHGIAVRDDGDNPAALRLINRYDR
jgi:hypothetical protein